MNKYTITEIDAKTLIETTRELTPEEQEELEKVFAETQQTNPAGDE